MLICDYDLQLVNEYSVIDSGSNMSDHCAMSASLAYNDYVCNVGGGRKNALSSVSLAKVVLTSKNIQLYQSAANVALLDVNIPECCSVCSGNCRNSAHKDELNNVCTDISTALLKAVGFCKTGKVVSKVV